MRLWVSPNSEADRRESVLEVHVGADLAGQAALGERDGDAAFRAVVRALDQEAADRVAHGRLHVALELEVERGRAAGHEAVLDLEVLAAAQLLERLADKDDDVALVLEADGGARVDIVHEADQADGGRRVDGLSRTTRCRSSRCR